MEVEQVCKIQHPGGLVAHVLAKRHFDPFLPLVKGIEP